MPSFNLVLKSNAENIVLTILYIEQLCMSCHRVTKDVTPQKYIQIKILAYVLFFDFKLRGVGYYYHYKYITCNDE